MRTSYKSLFVKAGDPVSLWVADFSADPALHIAVIVLGLAGFALGLKTDLLTAVLPILGITLTQRVLNSQKAREADDRQRDEAMYAKRDERLLAMTGVRDEMAWIEISSERASSN